ncbi:putative clathrin assembly protein [Hibiscus syriacus]|uniref:Clathrin assembly protein n=1 Tax=Hibiscus syriacus TaxID=106335 RepID=A0A6A2X1H0_HIBSY|nr:putative clathrin assembly protein [Hibiscus syriacus]
MPSTIQKAIGAVKDQTSIGLAKVASNMAPDLEVAIVKATSHEDDPAGEKYIREILNLTSYTRGYVHACISAVSKRLGKTRNWIVALKALVLVHRLLNEGDPLFQEEILYATRRGTRLLNMSDFRDEAHSSSWDHSAFIRTFAMYLDQRLELMLFDRKSGGGSGAGGSSHGSGDDRYGGRDNFRSPGRDDFRSPPPRPYEFDYGDSRGDNGYGNYGMPRRTRSYGDMRGSRERWERGEENRLAKNSRMILIALYPVVKESFQLYADICEVLAVLLDSFFDMEYPDCVKAFDAYASAAKQIDELIAFYNWCKDTGVARSSEYPEVQRITGKLLETLEEFVRDRAKRPKNPERKELPPPPKEEEPAPDMNEIKALPAPESYTPPPPLPEPDPLALALFNGPANSGNGSWEAFPSNGPEVTSAWQNPAAEPGKEDWELALVESASNLSRQKAALGGGLDPLLLNGMYDQGMVRQHVSTAQLSGGSASSVALPGPGKTTTQVLALPAPDGTVQNVNQDPFAASLSVPPPPYVQMSDMEKKQHFLVQEQQVWQQYSKDGMQGQASLAKISYPGYYGTGSMPMMPYGMPPVNGMGPPAGYYYTPY